MYIIIKKLKTNQSKKPNYSNIQYLWTITFMTQTSQNWSNIINTNLVFHFKIIFCSSFRFLQFNDWNFNYNGGGVSYLLESITIIFNLKVHTKPFSNVITFLKLHVNFPRFIFDSDYCSYYMYRLKQINNPFLNTPLCSVAPI